MRTLSVVLALFLWAAFFTGGHSHRKGWNSHRDDDRDDDSRSHDLDGLYPPLPDLDPHNHGHHHHHHHHDDDDHDDDDDDDNNNGFFASPGGILVLMLMGMAAIAMTLIMFIVIYKYKCRNSRIQSSSASSKKAQASVYTISEKLPPSHVHNAWTPDSNPIDKSSAPDSKTTGNDDFSNAVDRGHAGVPMFTPPPPYSTAVPPPAYQV